MTEELFKKITCFVFDIDGVLTDGMVLVLENGLQARSMNVKDGYALQLAIKMGYRILVISGAQVSPVIDRLNKLGVMDVHVGVTDKEALLLEYMAANGLKTEELLCMGDDIPDLPLLRMAGIAACPADAVGEIKKLATYISKLNGGRGCVREVIEEVLKLRGHWSEDSHISSN